MSLLREIQNDLTTADGDATTALRKCKILAARLGSTEFANWVEFELNGYPIGTTVPGYRRLGIGYSGSFSNIAWQAPRQAVPMQFVPEEQREAFKSIEFRDGIAKAVSFARSEHGVKVQRPELIFARQGKMYPGMDCHGVWGEIGSTEFEQLVSAVKYRILDFSLKIEAENPAAGEAPLHSRPAPMEKLQPLVQNVFYGPVGSVAQNSDNVSQTQK
jgi:hypothetical protein